MPAERIVNGPMAVASGDDSNAGASSDFEAAREKRASAAQRYSYLQTEGSVSEMSHLSGAQRKAMVSACARVP